MKLIAFVVYDDANLLDISGPVQVFAAASGQAEAMGLTPGPAYEVIVVSREGGIVQTSCGVGIQTGALAELEHRPMDTLLVTGGRGCLTAAEDVALVTWLKAKSGQARRFGSICTGAYLLAAAGLLRDRRATTHWEYTDTFGKRFPDVHFECDALFIEDGGVWTSAGVTAGIDMALAMVEQDLGTELALDTAKQLVLFLKRSGGQSPFSTFLKAQSIKDDRLRRLAAWILENPTEDLSPEALADRAHVSLRSLFRAFHEEARMTPREFVERARLEVACRLLEQSEDRIDRVAMKSGFASADGMRRAFRRVFNVSPLVYRERFSGTAPSKDPNRIEDPLRAIAC